jgi:hypothetical protein
MKRSLIALAATLLQIGAAPAWSDQPERVAVMMAPSEFEIVAVRPRNPETRPVLSSLPAPGVDRRATGDRQVSADRPGDGLSVMPNH